MLAALEAEHSTVLRTYSSKIDTYLRALPFEKPAAVIASYANSRLSQVRLVRASATPPPSLSSVTLGLAV